MSIQKKSLLNSLNTTKKAIVASSTPEDAPKVSTPVTGRVYAKKIGRTSPAHLGRVSLRVAGRVVGKKKK